ncbi:hypothetical protein SPRG_19267 [Saprolegnia parasitica CBS 223.65]|uniref:Phosphodiesterase n=1 Tax=Saprolegnia parasitica (strain CBS 223.65) TaxID=695850 RepID=A0A067D4L5_SAPPC|nr:hypothetical protein SPRG_19267 [Saprolegnia parasitica CBS 223.65]KDO33651.1 hypothetical protein SPRG_19267 [Saprolegnia parasitica CBS 223.65]|eukprot:XP_012195684.1 hypothetical protein SPRG_19267 [Saprolegnia parasitica CBS 223.65]
MDARSRATTTTAAKTTNQRCDRIAELEAQVARYQMQEAKERRAFSLIQDVLEHDDLYMMMDVFFAFVEGLFSHDPHHQCAVFLLDAGSDSMAKIVPKLSAVEAVPTTCSLAAEVAASGTTFMGRSLPTSYNPAVDLERVAPSNTLLCFALLDSSGETFAVIEASSASPDSLCAYDLGLLQRLGPILSNAMRKAIELHDIVLSQRTQAALLHIVSSSSNEETILKLVQRVIKGANHIVHCESVTLFLLDWPRNELWSLSSSFRRSNLRFSIDGCLLGAAALSSNILNVKHAPSDPRFDMSVDDRFGGTKTALYVPIGVHQMNDVQPIAVLECINKVGGHKTEFAEFTYEDECAFEAFASEVAVILRRRSQETDYLKLLADTKSESLWAERAQSQVNLLEAFTSKPCTLQSHLADRLSDSFFSADSLSPLPLETPPRPPTALFKTKSVDVPMVPRWSLNVFTTELETLLSYTQHMLLDPVMALPNLDPDIVQNFIQSVQDHYHPNPFHNFLHGFSVLHTSYCILKETQAVTVLTPPDRFGCLLAALCHDIDHPGHSNVFEVNSKSGLALLHNDDAVLERHHAATTFRLLQNEHVNLLASLTPDEYRYTRKVIVRAIIGTDMARHFEHIEALEKRWAPYARTTDPLLDDKRAALAGFAKSGDDRIFLVQTIVHASDLGAQVFPTPIALKWSNMIAKEFAYQALMETAEGLPVTHLHVDDPLHMVESQHFFAARLVQPLWSCLVRFLPKLDHRLVNLQKNIAHYEQEIRRLKQLSPHSPRKRSRPNIAHNEGQAIPGTTRCTPAKFNSFRLCPGDLKSQLSFSSLISDFSSTSLDTNDDMNAIDDDDDDDDDV